jgi:hypothetical protein
VESVLKKLDQIPDISTRSRICLLLLLVCFWFAFGFAFCIQCVMQLTFLTHYTIVNDTHLLFELIKINMTNNMMHSKTMQDEDGDNHVDC